MKGQTVQVRVAAGMQRDLPQSPESASLVENWGVDNATEGFTSRIGYERYRPSISVGFAPFSSLGRIDSLFVAQQLPGGARQHIFFESSGQLYLYYESGQNALLVPLSSRVAPSATEAPSSYAQVGDRIVVVNGYDSPVVINPWPLPTAAEISAGVTSQVIRPLGWAGPPSQPEALNVSTLDADATPTSAIYYTGNSTSNWYPAVGGANSFPGLYGMGYSDGSDADARNDYRFKVTFISDTGSESPLSQDVLSQWTIENGTYGFRYAPTLRIPLGPKGTRARRIYATQDDGQDYFFVADVRNNVEEMFHAFRRSNALGFSAPGPQQSSIFPAPRARVCAAFKDCLFLDGGANEADTIFFSKPGFIDQFGAADYIRLPSDGGAITGLYGYYNNLVVTRENGVDVVTGAYPDFTAQTVTRQVSCRSPQTLAAVPGVGVMFLAQDGVYALRGGLDGGAVFEVVAVGQPINDELARLTSECAPRAVAEYSPVERAYHLYFPVDGNDRPNLGAVYHIEKEGWSIRKGFPVGCIARTFAGDLVFGHHTGVEAGENAEAGLFVLSGARALGGALQQDVFVQGPPPESIYQSAWHDFGDPQIKKQVQYATLWVMTTGTVKVSISYYKDFDGLNMIGEEVDYVAQPPDSDELPVYDTAVLEESVWTDSRLIPLRIPVAVESCSWFRFELKTTDDLILVGYELEYMSRGTQVVAGRTA